MPPNLAEAASGSASWLAPFHPRPARSASAQGSSDALVLRDYPTRRRAIRDLRCRQGDMTPEALSGTDSSRRSQPVEAGVEEEEPPVVRAHPSMLDDGEVVQARTQLVLAILPVRPRSVRCGQRARG